MKSKHRAKDPYDRQNPSDLRDSIAGLAVSMAAVCGMAPHQRSASQTRATPLSDLYMGLHGSVDRPLSRFEAMLQASGGFARRLEAE